MRSSLDRVLDLLFEDPATGVLLMDESGWVTRGNEALARMVALPLDQIEGWPALMLVGEADRARFTAVIGHGGSAEPGMPFTQSLQGTGLRVSIQVIAIAGVEGSNNLRLVRVREDPVPDASGIVFDNQKLRTLGHLTAGVVHDFNNLLGAVLAAADTLAERARSRGDEHDVTVLAELRAGAARGRGLVGRLLGYGRPAEPALGALPVDAAIVDLADMLRRLFPQSIELILDLAAGDERVHADPTRFDQILVNLAINARDAMPNGGSLTIRSWSCLLEQGFDGVLGHVPPGSYIVTEVADSGTGIPADVLPLVFSPFFTTRRASGGHGLGLSTVREIVAEFGGYLGVRSKPGRGTRVRVYLPRLPTLDPPLPISRNSRAQPSVGRGTVLLVDDEAVLRKLGETALRRAGWRVLAADSAESALAMISEPGSGAGRPSVLVTDIGLPEMDGWSLAHAVRARLEAPELPLVLTSGTSRHIGAEMARLGGAAVFLAKPYSLAQLTAALEKFAHGPGLIDISGTGIGNVSDPFGKSELDEHITNKTLRVGRRSVAPEGLDVTDSAELD